MYTKPTHHDTLMASPVRVVILSDTHGLLDPRIADLVQQSDCAVHAGDIGCAAVLQRLRPRSGRVLAIRGNNDVPDRWAEADGDLLATLQEHAELALPGGTLVLDHGHRALPVKRRHELLRRRYPQARAVVYGHSHRWCIDRDQEPWVLNPGAAGRVRTYGGPSCLLLSASDASWRVEYRRFHPVPRAHGPR